MTKPLHIDTDPLNSRLSTARFTLLLVIGLVAFYNRPLWSEVLGLPHEPSLWNALFLASFFVFLVVLLNLLLSLVAFKYVLKPLTVLILMTTACATYFMDSYGVMIDYTMIQNVVETHPEEALELLNGRLLFYVGLLGVLPSLLVYRARIHYRSWLGELKLKAGSLLLSMAAIAFIALIFYQDYASRL